MPNCDFRAVQEADYAAVSAIYNSNRSFLRSHLGMDRVDEAFVAEEAACMRKLGFCSCAIVSEESAKLLGVLDYRTGQEVYLSLIMLDESLQGQGVGRSLYLDFERQMLKDGSKSIRIDVVNDYPGHLVPFWKKLGFSEGESVTLDWGKKSSRAVVMRKSLQA